MSRSPATLCWRSTFSSSLPPRVAWSSSTRTRDCDQPEPVVTTADALEQALASECGFLRDRRRSSTTYCTSSSSSSRDIRRRANEDRYAHRMKLTVYTLVLLGTLTGVAVAHAWPPLHVACLISYPGPGAGIHMTQAVPFQE